MRMAFSCLLPLPSASFSFLPPAVCPCLLLLRVLRASVVNVSRLTSTLKTM
jgi:hypothetical protein